MLRAITSPENRGSIEFHRSLGFDLEPVEGDVAEVPIHDHYGPNGEARVLLVKRL